MTDNSQNIVEQLATSQAIAAPSSTLDRFVVEPLLLLWDRIVAHLPAVATGIMVLVVLIILAKLARAALQKILAMSRLDRAMADTRLSKALSAFQKGFTPSSAIAYIVYLAVLLVAWTTAADIVGLQAVRDTLSAILGYLPRLISALLVITIGGYIASGASRTVLAILREVRHPLARLLAGLTELLLMIVVCTLAIDVLGADMTLITSNLTALVAIVAITVAFLFAWSMRRPAEEIIANYYLRRMLRVGDRVEVGGHRGSVVAFQPLGVIIVGEDSEAQHFIPAHHVLNGLRRQGAVPPPRKGS